MSVMRFVRVLLAFVIPASWVSLCCARSPAEAAAKLEQFLNRFEDIAPGYSVVVVSPDEILLCHVRGVLREGGQQALTADSPMYIASQTKAYIGLLASRLHHAEILSLDDRISDHWSTVKFPEGVDPDAWSLRDLLTHQVPVDCDYLAAISKNLATIPAKDVVSVLEQHAQPRPNGFKYSNVGYLIWAAILETSTKRSWKEWLNELVLREMAMNETTSQSSTFGLQKLSWRHTWLGHERGWHALPPKPNMTCHAAGGLFASANNLARFLRLHLRGNEFTKSRLDQDVIATCHAIATPRLSPIPDHNELSVSGYALGWYVCDYEGHKLYSHGGGYPGARTQMAFSPDLGFGIAVSCNSDSATGWLSGRVIVQFLQYLVDDPKANVMATQRVRRFVERRNQQLSDRTRRVQQVSAHLSEATTGARTASGFPPGKYIAEVSNNAPLVARLVRGDNGQELRIGGLVLDLKPLSDRQFALFSSPLSYEGILALQQSRTNEVTGFEWKYLSTVKLRFERTKND